MTILQGAAGRYWASGRNCGAEEANVSSLLFIHCLEIVGTVMTFKCMKIGPRGWSGITPHPGLLW